MNNIYFFFFYSLIGMQLSSFAGDDFAGDDQAIILSPSKSFTRKPDKGEIVVIELDIDEDKDKENTPSHPNTVSYGSPKKKVNSPASAMVLSPSKQLVKKGDGKAITPFGLKISLPKNVTVVDPLQLDEGYQAYYQKLQMHQQRVSSNFWKGKGTTIPLPLYSPISSFTRNPFPATLPTLESVLQQNQSRGPHSSALCHSADHQTRLYLIGHIEDAMIYSEYVRVENPEINKHELSGIVDEIMEGFNEALSKPLKMIQTAHDFKNRLDILAMTNLLKPEKKPLTILLEIYQTNQGLFKDIAAKDLAGEIAHEQTKDGDAFEEQYINNYRRLIDNKIFINILHEEHKHDFQTNKEIYDLINQWHFIAQTFAVTSLVGTPLDKNAGKSIYSNVMFPILNHIFLNQKGYYHSLQIFSYTFQQTTRFNVIKLKVQGLPEIPAIVLCAFPPPPIVVQKPQEPTQTTAAPKKESRGCVIS